MTPGRGGDVFDDDDDEELDDEPPRSLFSSAWIRVALVLVVLGVIAAIAAPYVRESMGPEVASRELSPSAKPAVSVVAPAPETTVVTPPSNQPSLTSSPQHAVPEEPSADAPRAPVPPAARPAVKREAPGTDRAARASAADQPATPTIGDAAGDWWVQIAALRDGEAARRLADRLRRRGFRVEEHESVPAGAATDRYEVFVAGALPAELVTTLESRGLTARGEPGGAVVTPALPRQDALSLAAALKSDGFKTVELKLVAPIGPAGGDPALGERTDGLHRVRVSGFADRGAAVAASRELRALGYEGSFIGRGRE